MPLGPPQLPPLDLRDVTKCHATVVITTRDRRDELRITLASCLTQDIPLEILVVDDASSDGTLEMMLKEFPGVRFERSESALGYIVQRNRAAHLVNTPLIISIDDDAVFTSVDIARKAIAAFDERRVGAIAIPFINVHESSEVFQLASDDNGVYVTTTFIGTAHAVRRDLFLALGGYREFFYSRSEESDYCLRMLQAGYVVRVIQSAAIHHMQSPRRLARQIVMYGQRNQVLVATMNFPLRFLFRSIPALLWHGLRGWRKHGHSTAVIQGWLRGCLDSFVYLGERSPVTVDTFILYRQIGIQRNQMRLDDPTWTKYSQHSK